MEPADSASGAVSADSADSTAFAAWTLECGPRSPGTARGYARTALRGWGLEELTDDISVSVSEMVTNALCHSMQPWVPPSTQPVMLSMLRQGHTVLCAVIDPGCSAPAVRDADELAESGRGLEIVDYLADAWGWTTPGPNGKAVWARFTTPEADDCDEAAGLVPPPEGLCAADAHDGAEWDALTRLLMLVEILGGTRPPWLAGVGLRPADGRSQL
ncbi:ATP-binding protein [Streptomyces sp. JJ66]|uniref:ATP-binding protein n=1 Tax=Streptomyces sp. JJ66 TaxID=2803843 RepID=UPI001C58678C|nr:ATP-binding protein [Streptomyces sp. JJ66]MBW1603087.1 ATP-binding protein [Streptomyces sp. JJ66]